MIKCFFFGYEKGITALFSAYLFVIAGLLFHKVSTLIKDHSKYWKVLSYVAYFLACDEWFAIHDAALNIYGKGLFNIPIWLMVYGTAAVFIFVISIPVLLKTPKKLVFGLILSGLIFITGSGVMEVLTYDFNDKMSVANHVGWFFEDSLEMLGVICLIGIFSQWLNEQQVNSINLKNWVFLLILGIGVIDLVITSFYL